MARTCKVAKLSVFRRHWHVSAARKHEIVGMCHWCQSWAPPKSIPQDWCLSYV